MGGTAPTARKRASNPFPPLPTAALPDRFHKFVCLNSLKRRASKRQGLPPPISSFPRHPAISLVPTTYGKSNGLSKLPGRYFGMQLKTNTQPTAPATTSKSELSRVLYLHSRTGLHQHGNTLPGSVRLLLGLNPSSAAPRQALKYGHKHGHAIALQKAPEQVRHRADSKNSLLILVLHQVPSQLNNRRRVLEG